MVRQANFSRGQVGYKLFGLEEDEICARIGAIMQRNDKAEQAEKAKNEARKGLVQRHRTQRLGKRERDRR